MASDNRQHTFDPASTGGLEAFLKAALKAKSVRVATASLLPGGAVGENWSLAVVVDGETKDWVLRTDPLARIAMSHGRLQEFQLIEAAHAAGVLVPEPVAASADASIAGKPFSIVRRLPGNGQGRKLVRDPAIGEFGRPLAETLGENLARLHGIIPPKRGLDFLAVPDRAPGVWQVRHLRGLLDGVTEKRPALEYALTWLSQNAPDPAGLVLCHGDFRTGNYLVENRKLTGILDWEFAHWGDRHEDLGWFCARCWRFGGEQRPAGGIASREALFASYERVAGQGLVDRAAMPYWEILAAARWAVVALLQGERHHSGVEPSLELLLTGMLSPEMEFEALTGIEALMDGSKN